MKKIDELLIAGKIISIKGNLTEDVILEFRKDFVKLLEIYGCLYLGDLYTNTVTNKVNFEDSSPDHLFYIEKEL